MLKQTIWTTLLLCAVFVFSPDFVYGQDPYTIDDFEGGPGKWSTGQGAGAPSATIEETKDAHDSKAGKITMPGGTGWLIVRSQDDQNFAQLEEGYEAFNFWVKGLEGTDNWIRIMFYGIGDISGQNRWIYDFKAPQDEWMHISVSFEDIQPWRNEVRPFEVGFLNFIAFVQEGSPPLGGEQTTWGDIEFIVDDIEIGLVMDPDMPVEPSEKLTATWGQIKQH